MSRTVVVPLDQSTNAERAIPFARSLAQQLRASVLLVTVYEIPSEYAHGAKELEWEGESYLAGVANRMKPLAVSTQVMRGKDPAIETESTVSELEDPIVVMSSHGQSRARRMIIGSKTARLVQLAKCPVVVVPAHVESLPQQVKSLLVSMDGSPFAEHALDTSRALFNETLPALHLLRIIDRIRANDSFKADLRWTLYDEASQYLQGIARPLQTAGWKTTLNVNESWDVAETIVTAAQDLEDCLIVIGTHGRTGFSRLFLGSVADAVIRSARTPVLVVRPTAGVVRRLPDRRLPKTEA